MQKVIYSFLDRIMHSGLCSPVGFIIPILRKIDGLISSGHDVNHQQSTLNRSSPSFRLVSLMLLTKVNDFRIMSEISCQCLYHAYRSLIEVLVAMISSFAILVCPSSFWRPPAGIWSIVSTWDLHLCNCASPYLTCQIFKFPDTSL
jgi:hypothetical protein